ncbi:response regulator transcription factor [Mediterraneibacter glycyrrhizinilyticus]|uniref:response regulator n=1 Tax=Mediterraneibacter glycyrrhizinilyticus TaxID=342942 RepID=UPI001960FB48|nr:response regulator transcription factor [Mediterraneibacter glycyrrhizinilyticus]MBM6751956.1 response regulator transcription factor [Mediterraneibacter glycyrrhizinilyticus]
MENKKTILIVEDDKYIIHFLSMSFKEEAYAFQVAGTVKEAVSLFYANRPDLVILDLGLPDGDGMEVIRTIREIADTPVIVVSARQEEEEKIRALDAGADDYVTKPFYMGELLARIRAALRKAEIYPQEKASRFEQGDLLVDYEQRRVEVEGTEVHLTPIEYKILTLLIANRGKVLTHHYILKEIWGYAEGVEAGTLRVFMATLRRKIEKNPSAPQHIITEVGVGYRFK